MTKVYIWTNVDYLASGNEARRCGASHDIRQRSDNCPWMSCAEICPGALLCHKTAGDPLL